MTLRFARLALLAGAAALAVPAQADTLRDALARAYVDNPTLLAARAQQRANDENEPIQRANGLPDVRSTVTHIEFLRRSPNSFTAPERNLQAGIDLTVPLYSGGAVKNSVRAARDRIEAGRADLRGTESAVFSQVVAAYMDVLRGQALVGLSANQVDVLSVNLEATRDRFEIGDLTRTDIAQSESRLAVAQSDLRSAQANLIGARENYIALVGAAPTGLEPPPPLPGFPASADEAVATALEHNPDLIAARERAEASEFDVKVAGSGRLPTLGAFVGADYSNFFGTLGGPVSATLEQTETTANAGLRLTIPIFQGGRPAAQVRQAQARSTATLENVIATERDVIAQTRASWSSWQAANAIIESAQTAVAAAELSLEGVRAENSIGNRTILEVLNAEQELLAARVQLVTARRNAYVAGFSLLAAMGKAEARDLGLDDEGVLYDPMTNYERVKGAVWDWDRDPDSAAQATRTVDIPAPDASVPGSQTGDAALPR